MSAGGQGASSARPGHGPDRLLAEADRADDRAVTDLLAEIAELREGLARSIAERDAAVTVGEARAAALRELADRLTAELAEARRPFWRRWW